MLGSVNFKLAFELKGSDELKHFMLNSAEHECFSTHKS